MSGARRKYLVGLTLLLLGGLFVGWLYGRPVWGLLVATGVALGWQVRQLFSFENMLHNKELAVTQQGNGIWSGIFSQVAYLRHRSLKQKKRYRRLARELRRSIDSLPDGGIVLNGSFEIVSCNAAAEELVGLKLRQDRGHRVDNILRDPKFTSYLGAGKFENGVELRSPLAEGHWLNYRMVPYGAKQHLLLVRDVTEQVRLGKIRRDFIANASHELRSPLTVISGYLDTLVTDAETPEHWRKPVAQMQTQAGRLNNIIAELIELSRLESVESIVGSERVDVCNLLAAAKKAYADEDNLPSVNVECQSGDVFLGSAPEIESVITNLLSNAIRHTPADGAITLSWSGNIEGGQLVVADTGEGIVAEDVPRLTERFFRVNRGRSRDDGGIGLGLAIVKHALSRHGGTLEIVSEPGQGSRFICHFPRERMSAADSL